MHGDASATYRGYRKQALYVLWRVIRDPSTMRVYRPEGAEDLAVYEGAQLVEAIQVKDHGTPLALSDLKSHSPTGFFSRMRQRRRDAPSSVTILASYGALGPELSGAIDGAPASRSSVVSKLGPTLSEAEAKELLDALRGNVVILSEPDLTREIDITLRATIVGDTSVALELLLFWIYQASERRSSLTRSTLLAQMERIGRCLASMRDTFSEWYTSIIPISDEILSQKCREELVEEYRRGAQAQWSHILADADVPRLKHLRELREAMQQSKAVVVRGPSGQGKSSLGWRYLREYASDGARFLVRFIQGRKHASSVANAIASHCRQLQITPVVFIDLSPESVGWAGLVEDLRRAGVSVLIAAREEDLFRASSELAGARFGSISLTSLSEEEAREIYNALQPTSAEGRFLNFDDAWARFSASTESPLLEFTHLVTQGRSLSATICGQVARLRAEVRSASAHTTQQSLRLLALCAVANACEARVDYLSLCKRAATDPLAAPLAPFEREYLLRVRTTGARTTIQPLHSLRSQALVDALVDNEPSLWAEVALEVLPLVVPEDVETYLLHCFSRREQQADLFEAALAVSAPQSWAQAAGIVRALLWLGISRYEQRNKQTIASALEQFGAAWQFFADVTFGLPAETRESVWRTLSRQPPPVIATSPKEEMLQPLLAWLAVVAVPGAPQSASDWRGAGSIAFWVGSRGVAGPMRLAIAALLPVPLPEGCPLSDLAEYIAGRATLGDTSFSDWHAAQASVLHERLVAETESLGVDDDGDTIVVFFAPSFVPEEGDLPTEIDLNGQAMRRVELARSVFPNRAVYGAQSIGTEVLEGLGVPDDTQKRIPAENLPDGRLVWVNATFSGLIAYRQLRDRNWTVYVDNIIVMRETALQCCEALCTSWEDLLAESKPRPRTVGKIPAGLLECAERALESPLLPRPAVDEWGFVSEGRQRSAVAKEGTHAGRVVGPSREGALASTAEWRKAFDKYQRGLSSVFQRAAGASLEHLQAKNKMGALPDNPDGRLLLVNLHAAWSVVVQMQRTFARLFGAGDAHLREREKAALARLWLVAFPFVNEPRRRRKDAARFLAAAVEKDCDALVSALRRELEAIGHDFEVLVDVALDGRPCLVVLTNSGASGAVRGIGGAALVACWRATRIRRWRVYEWESVSRRWVDVVVLHTINRRMIHPCGIRVSLATLCGHGEDFEPSALETTLQDLRRAELEAAGIRFYDVPLLSAIIAWRASVLGTLFLVQRVQACVRYVDEAGTRDDLTDPVESRFRRELAGQQRELSEREAELLAIATLDPWRGTSSVARVVALLGEADPNAYRFRPYLSELAEDVEGFLELTCDAIDTVIGADGA